jgi:hypothetical protein
MSFFASSGWMYTRQALVHVEIDHLWASIAWGLFNILAMVFRTAFPIPAAEDARR